VLEHLRGLVARFPHHAGLNHLLVEWLAEEPLLARERAIGELLHIFPGSAGARRELATVLARQQRFEEAYVQLEHARAIAPASESYYACLGNIDALRGDHAAARSAYRTALAISVDLEPAMQRLLDVCGSHEELARNWPMSMSS